MTGVGATEVEAEVTYDLTPSLGRAFLWRVPSVTGDALHEGFVVAISLYVESGKRGEYKPISATLELLRGNGQRAYVTVPVADVGL